MATRGTVQQRIVASQLAALHGSHPTADDVYRGVRATHPNISKATVYRILNKMADAHTALKVRTPFGADHFDDTLQPHCHVICTRCGRVDDVELPGGAGLAGLDARASAPGYLITGHELLFTGLCPFCRKAPDGGQAPEEGVSAVRTGAAEKGGG